MRNPFELYNQKKSDGLFVDTTRAQLQIDQMPLPSNIKRLHDQSASVFRRLRWIGLLVIVVLAALISRLAYLQLWKGDEYRAQAEGNRLREQRVTAARGVFFDRNGQQLVTNVPDFTIELIPKDLPRNPIELEKTTNIISGITQINLDELKELIKTTPISQPSVTLLEHVEYSQAIQFMVDFQSVPGVRVDTSFQRSYSSGSMWSAILGYMGKINSDEWEDLVANQHDYSFDAIIGKTGLEETYEELLRGTDGKRLIEVNAQGKEQAIVSSSEAIPGDNLILTIDNGLQQAAQNSLDSMVEKLDSTGGAAVVLDAKSGEVLALVTSPTYDNQWFAQGITQDQYDQLATDPRLPLFNRVISGEFPSGSVFKPVVAAAGLAEQVITPNTTILSVGGIDINGSFFPDWRAGGHGQTDVRKALADSVNTFFYLLGGGDNETNTGLGVDRIVDYAKKFGLSRILGIDLPNEQPGFLPSKAWKEEVKNELWYIGDTYHLAIGQGDLLVTPLQVAEYTMAIANGGTLWKPHLAKTILSQDGSKRTDVAPEALATEVVDDQYLQTVREGMRQAVTAGSARGLSGLAWPMAAKTGTAEHPGSNLPNYDYHSWLTAFGPYDDPSIVVTILVENGGEGTAAALPVARDILNYYISAQSTAAGG